METENDKTVGNHWHIFRPPILLKMPFKGTKTFFSQKILIYKNIHFSQNKEL